MTMPSATMKKLRSDAKFDERPVWAASLDAAEPVFHLAPSWDRERWRGEAVLCNRWEPPVNDAGTLMPERIVAPCGQTQWRRHINAENDVVAGIAIHTPARMVDQGIQIPLGHARKIGRPCSGCFPEGWPA